MNELINKIRYSEFLSSNEILRVKVSLVLGFLIIFGVLTVPVSFFEELSLGIKIFVPLAFSFLYIATTLLLVFNKNRLAMHFSIYTFIGLTIYYVDSTSQFYGYILLFFTISVIIFYQDIYTYIVYGGVITAYGVYYIYANSADMMGLNELSPLLSAVIYQTILIAFFLVFIVYFVLADSIYERFNFDYQKTKKYIGNYEKFILRMIKDYTDREGLNQVYENVETLETVNEISYFLSELLNHNPDTLSELSEFYFFIHDHDLGKILDHPTLANKTKEYAKALEKYLLNVNSEMNEILLEYTAYYKQSYDTKIERYSIHLDKAFSNRTNRVLAIAIIYKILRTEVTQLDKWGRFDRVMTHDEIKQLFESKLFRDYFSFEDVNFFLENENIFRSELN